MYIIRCQQFDYKLYWILTAILNIPILAVYSSIYGKGEIIIRKNRNIRALKSNNQFPNFRYSLFQTHISQWQDLPINRHQWWQIWRTHGIELFMKKQNSRGSVKARPLILTTRKVKFPASLFDKEVDGKEGWQKSHGSLASLLPELDNKSL